MANASKILPKRRATWSDTDWEALHGILDLTGPRAGLVLTQRRIDNGHTGKAFQMGEHKISETRVAQEMFHDTLNAEETARQHEIQFRASVVAGVSALLAALGGVALGHFLGSQTDDQFIPPVAETHGETEQASQ